jgi:hypothetical protein
MADSRTEHRMMLSGAKTGVRWPKSKVRRIKCGELVPGLVMEYEILSMYVSVNRNCSSGVRIGNRRIER